MTTLEYKPNKKEQLFSKYYKGLIWETISARAHLKLNERLEEYKADYLKELNQAPHFFILTIRAHYDDALLTLSRILDRQKNSLSIWKFLNFVEQNREIFSEEVFSQRIKDNPYHESLIESHESITCEEIEEDRGKLGNLEDTITKVKDLRDTILAHNDRRFIIRGRISAKKHDVQREKLYRVIDTLFKILNRYSRAYNSSTFSENILGEDDIGGIMDSIRFHIQERKKQLEELKKQARNKG